MDVQAADIEVDAAPIDQHFAALLGRLDTQAGAEVLQAARCLSRATRAGHVCVPIEALPAFALAEESMPSRLDVAAWRAALQRSAIVGAPGDFAPLIHAPGDRLYLQRYWQYETDVATALQARAATSAAIDPARARAALDRYFPSTDSGTDWQRVAAAVALTRRLTVISGGPGTGKTSTVLRLLAVLLECAESPPRIALAAPTGLAAARLEQALVHGREHLALDAARAAQLPARATTLHRLLGTRRHSPYFRHDRDNPLRLDVLVVDEASMVDLALMAKLLAALPAEARLVLLGDRDQLASVEAGAVLGDICAAGRGMSEAGAQALAELCGTLPASESGTDLGNCIVTLRRSYRFAETSPVAGLARAIIDGDADAAWTALNAQSAGPVGVADSDAGIVRSPHFRAAVLAGYRGYLERVRAGATAVEVVAAFQAFRVLCAHRIGTAGALEANAQIEALLDQAGLIAANAPWYAGRPVVVVENDYELGVFNGDIGVALEGEAGTAGLRVFFADAGGGLRDYAPARLPQHELAFALTVHKAQGSEFDEVLVLLPARSSAVVTRELLYTAVTRARTHVRIWGTETVIREGVGRRIRRGSALAERLGN